MKHKTWLVALTALLLCAAPVRAQVYDPKTGDPPSGQHVHFTSNEWKVAPTPDGGALSGSCRVDCYTDEYDQVFVSLRGLQRQGRYTVWMVNVEKGESTDRAGVARHWNGDDAERFDFVAEANGNGFYNGWLSRCPLGKWKYLEVRYHPNGNVKDLDASVTVLRVRIRPQ